MRAGLLWSHLGLFWLLALFTLWNAIGTKAAEHHERSGGALASAAGAPSNMARVLVSAAGKDVGRRVMDALAALRGPGVVRVDTPGTIATTIVLGKGQSVEFGQGTWRVTTRPGFVLDDASEITGAGVHRTQLVLEGTKTGPMITSANFDVLTGRTEAEVCARPSEDPAFKSFGGGIKGAAIRELQLTGTGGKADSGSVGIKIYGYWWSLHDVLIDRFAGDGLYTEWIVGTGQLETFDTPESWITNVKLLANGGNGWTDRGSHDSVATNLMVANNGGWGIDVQHSDGHYSGGGLMLTAAHLYGNRSGGLRTARGANIHAYGLESESNFGPGLLLRSNDNVVQAEFYANTTYGLQVGERDADNWAAFNTIHVQSHNNHLAQIAWFNGDGNMVTGAVFAMKGQKIEEGKPHQRDSFLATIGGTTAPGDDATLPGGFVLGSEGGFYGAKLVQTLNGAHLGEPKR